MYLIFFIHSDADYAAPTAMMMMNLVWGRSGANVPLDLVWQAILGVTDQYQRAHITDEYYEELCHNLRVSPPHFELTSLTCLLPNSDQPNRCVPILR